MSSQTNLSNIDDDKCARCGKCCIIWNGKSWIDCSHLHKSANPHFEPLTYCDIYEDRIGEYLGHHYYCCFRSTLGYDIPGCPYNDGYPIHPAYRDDTAHIGGCYPTMCNKERAK